jgi:asparagine synthase (glutamine-hydrolysing)
MTALCGWWKATAGEHPPNLVLETMLRARSFGSRQQQYGQASHNAGLLVEGRARECTLATDGSLWAAIGGRPRWTHPALTALAAAQGHGAALLEAYRRSPVDLFTHLRGAFSLAVIDAAADRAILAIDRFGIETLCYSQPRSGGLVFASNADLVRAHPAVDATISDQAIFDFINAGICFSPGTIYREQRKLLPGQCLTYQNGSARLAFYWQMPYREETGKPLPLLTEELMALLRSAVARGVMGEDPAALGAFLSGGLDSSTVAGLLSEASGKRAKTFTIGFAQAAYDEVRYAEVAARHFGTEQYNHYLTPEDVAALLPDLARAFDEPFGNSSAIPAYYCARMARESSVQLMFAGDGGDEIFAGNSRYTEQQVLQLYQRIPGPLRSALIEPVIFGLSGLDRFRLGRRARSYIERARLPMPDRMDDNSFPRHSDMADIVSPELSRAVDPQARIAAMREAYDRSGTNSMLQRMLQLDLKITLADNDLRKVGKTAEMLDLPIYYPFLDDDVAEFAAGVPPALLVRGLQRRWFFKQAVSGFLPAETIAKKKHGFGMPFGDWPREVPLLREIADDCLRGSKRRGYLRPEFVDRLIALRAAGEGSPYDALVWDVMTLELWLRERSSVPMGGS